jgi:hypothetical protein
LRKKLYIPQPSRHRCGQAVVRLNGRDHYLGPHASDQAQAEYDRLIGLWIANGRRLPDQPCDQPRAVLVKEIVLAYYEHARTWYVKDGRETSTMHSVRRALGIAAALRRSARDVI